MLKWIEIAGETTYADGSEGLSYLKKINFVFGQNDRGKKTISRTFQDPASRTCYPALAGIAGNREMNSPCIPAVRNRQVMLQRVDDAA